MKIFKKLLIVILSLSMIFGLFACNKDVGVETDTVHTEIAPVNVFDCAVVYADGLSENVLEKITAMHTRLTELSGADNAIAKDTDSAADSSEKELLIGSTDRAESAQVEESLIINEFAVAVVGNKIVIDGLTDTTLIYAIEYFSNTYLADGADGSIEEDLFHKDNDGSICLVDRGEAEYSFVKASVETQEMVDQMNRISDAIFKVSGAKLAVKDDSLVGGESHDDEAKEILFGDTNYTQTQACVAKVGPYDYSISIEGNKIVVYAWTLDKITKAADDFCSMIANADIIVGENGEKSVLLPKTAFITNVDGEPLYFTDIPRVAAGRSYDSIYDCYDNTLMLYWENATQDMMTSYSAELETQEFEKYQSLDNESINSITYTKDGNMVHTYYLKKTKTFRVITQPDATMAVNPYNYVKECPVTVTQVGIGTRTGMCYLIRLEDGTFVVIDGNWISDVTVGGVNIGDTPDILYDAILEQMPIGVTDIVISAWIITHGHGDHYGMFEEFTRRYEKEITVKSLICNDPSDEIYTETNHIRRFIYNSYNGRYNGCQVKKTHTGEQFFFPGITFTMLYTHEDMYPDSVGIYNNISLAFDGVVKSEAVQGLQGSVQDGQTRFIWMGDVENKAGNRIGGMYTNTLKCDVLQIGHHGFDGGSMSFYQHANPIIAFYPTNALGYSQGKGYAKNQYIMNSAKKVCFQDEGNYTITFG